MADTNVNGSKGFNTSKVFGIVVLVLVVAFVAWKLFDVATKIPRGQVVELITKGNIEENQKDIANLLAANYKEIRDNTIRWSAAYFFCVFGGAILSAVAGVVLKLEFFIKDDALKKDLAAILAVSAAILVAVSTNGDFQTKWQANRIAASNIESLAYDLLRRPFNDDVRMKIIAEMKEINLKRNQEIVGESRSATLEPASKKPQAPQQAPVKAGKE